MSTLEQVITETTQQARTDRVKAILAGWYEEKDGRGLLRIEAGLTGSVMQIRWKTGRGLTSVDEAVGLIVLGYWRRVYVDKDEEDALRAKVIG